MSGIHAILMGTFGNYPIVRGSNVGTNTSSPGTSATVQLPTGIVSGELLLIFGYFDVTVGTGLAITGWTRYINTTGPVIGGFWRIADGSEGATAAATWGTNAVSSWISMRISNWHGSAAPQIGTATSGTSASPDGPNLTPSWGAKNTLWLSVVSSAASGDVATAWPSGYIAAQIESSTGTTYGYIRAAAKGLNAASENPGAYTLTNSCSWRAQTVGVRGI